jgi:hypothetical protein
MNVLGIGLLAFAWLCSLAVSSAPLREALAHLQ